MTKVDESASVKFGPKKRAAKATLTRFETYITDTELDAIEIDELKIRVARFEEAYETFKDMQIEIAASDNTISVQELDAEAESVENKYIRLKVAAERIIKEKLKIDGNHEDAEQTVVEARVNIENIETRVNIDNHERVPVPAYNAHVRLPRIELPTFAGAYADWHAFYDMFNSIIHSNRDLSDTQKFHYLRSSLKGEASEVVSSLEISGNNYADAWARLKERYDNKRLIIQNHVKAIFDLPVVRKENSVALRQILDGVLKHKRALQTLDRPTEQWDDLLVHIVASKLDIRTIKEWENTIDPVDIPSFSGLVEFLKRRCQTLEAVAKTVNNSVAGANSRQASHHKVNNCNVATINAKCTYCQGEHNIYACKDFKGLSVNERVKHTKSKGLCLNCLRGKHLAKDCYAGPCKICSKRHNSLLHNDNQKERSEVNSKVTDENKNVKDTSDIVCSHSSTEIAQSSQVLLATAMVKIQHKDGHFIDVKALLDNDLQCVILQAITQRIPNVRIDRQRLDIPENIRLADPQFYVPSEVELLIGAEKFWDLLCVGQIRLGKGKPILQKTLLGWIVAGRIDTMRGSDSQTNCYLSCTQELDEALQKFWQLENVAEEKGTLTGSSPCEEHFQKTHCRNEQGRFVVRLPIKEDVACNMGNSKDIAMKRFLSLERKLNKNPSLKTEYVKFLREYEELGHMRAVDISQNPAKRVFLPHQAVVKETSASTRVRVVFDASSRDSKGISLNDALHKGPIIQSDLFSIVLRFRCFRYVLSADIIKMYRQILVHGDHTPLQTILWRESNDGPIMTYELVTLTYGTRPASFIAIKCLQQLAEEEGSDCPLAARAIREDFYVDDLLTGAETVEGLLQLKKQVTDILRKGGLELHKWNSNVPGVRKVSDQDNEEFVELEKEQESKLLGIRWNPREDTLHFVAPVQNKDSRVTKRAILSEISRLFDPLGLVGPVITLAKVLMQELWTCRIGWDDAVPMRVHNSWLLIRSQLSALESIKINRLVTKGSGAGKISLHGFCDASEQAYGACIYIVYRGTNNENSTALICSKSRVAPLKTLSLPRLELSGALLLTRLMGKVMTSLGVEVHNKYYWTDSQIVLAWIGSPARRWQTFVANRIGEIQSSSAPYEWRHVKSKENPADLISRGSTPGVLQNSSLWWEGPTWLKKENEFPIYNNKDMVINSLPEKRNETVTALARVREPVISFVRFSSLGKILRAMVYILRFIHNAKCAKDMRRLGNILVEELKEARDVLVGLIQAETWETDIGRLKSKQEVAKESKLVGLKPYLDERGLIRVGGRLDHSSLTQETKHPLLLPASHHFTRLVIRSRHEGLFHAGINATLASVREEFWPIHAKNEVKQCLRASVTCRKANPTPIQPLMGQLPEARVNISRPFSKVGVDYCGPLFVRDRVKRNSKQYKAYVAIFVCMATKAVHIELVEDMTTEAFIGTLKRFIARRGLPSDIYSDNGRNFVGAEREIRQLFDDAEFKRRIHETTAKEGISWHFIPARAPHFGGLWEAAVKAMKRHLKRTVGAASLTVTEMITVLSQTEAILNSRPLTPMSDDPRDLEALTPGHFLIGSAMKSLPQSGVLDIPINRLSRWQHTDQIHQRLWSRWSKEYLTTCQKRTKWKIDAKSPIRTGQLVMMKEDEIMPWRWTLARVLEEHRGKDGIVRAVTVRTARGDFKRPVVKMAPISEE
ncbi:PREDICTED: uncharacterized protein LOC105556071 [Vollenhovia emeryi]|uniref:uncharacterized protein LOC105556071 n=1 Tax=Vollenhovia emeryi TaxID=411798 RepID=UPI0005F4B96E|nr:PREDICTED: uncharacterized protein LOC105556071 [Vollenhovia emeryi]